MKENPKSDLVIPTNHRISELKRSWADLRSIWTIIFYARSPFLTFLGRLGPGKCSNSSLLHFFLSKLNWIKHIANHLILSSELLLLISGITLCLVRNAMPHLQQCFIILLKYNQPWWKPWNASAQVSARPESLWPFVRSIHWRAWWGWQNWLLRPWKIGLSSRCAWCDFSFD